MTTRVGQRPAAATERAPSSAAKPPAPAAPPQEAPAQAARGWSAQGAAATRSAASPRGAADLNAYAQELLKPGGALQQEVDGRLTRMGIDPATATPLASAYTLTFPPGAFADSDVAQLREVADSLGRFVADTHVFNKGRPSDYFRSVEVLPFAKSQDELKLEAAESKLVVGLKKDWRSAFMQYHAPTNPEIRKQWNAGEQFDSKALKLAWPLLNPAGELRNTLGRTVKNAALGLAQSLVGVQGSSDSLATKKTAIARLLGNSVNEQVTSASRPGSTVLAEAKALVANVKTEKELHTFVDRFVGRLKDPGLATASTVAVQQAVLNSKLDAKIRIDGGMVAVGNLHDISVNASFAGGEVSRLSRYVVEVPKTRNIDVDVKSKGVAVYTVDLIDVNATFDLMLRAASNQHVLETAALDEALDVLRR